MADAKKCDRCNKFYDPIKYNPSDDYFDGRPIIMLTAKVHGIEADYDLCPECGEEFRNWFGRDLTRIGSPRVLGGKSNK